MIAPQIFDELGISMEDQAKINAEDISKADSSVISKLELKQKNGSAGLLYKSVFLTEKRKAELASKPYVLDIIKQNEYLNRFYKMENQTYTPVLYPITYDQVCGFGDFPKIWIPKRGETITFDTDVDYKVAAYKRCIKNYENNEFEYRDGKVYINGQQANSYTFKLDYYFMMGDNRDNSADSRVWGFVPEDHIVGKPLFIWLSLDKDKGWFSGKIRWNRLFTSGNKK